MFIEIKSEAQFEEEIKSGKVLVDFNATWCGPCQMLKPSIERLGERDDIKVLAVDTDENPGVAAKFDIYSIPTLLSHVLRTPLKLLSQTYQQSPKNKPNQVQT